MPDTTSLLTPEGTPERCGILTKDGEILELTNCHDDPLRGFRVSPLDIITHFDNAVATWHTHPGADPNLSEEDYAGFMQWPDLEHHIIGVRDGQPLVIRYAVEEGVLVNLCD